jgi:hypothetical protein
MVDARSSKTKMNLNHFSKNYFSPHKKRKTLVTTHGSARSHSGFGVRFVKMIRPDIDRNTAKEIFKVNHKKIIMKKADPCERQEFSHTLKKMKLNEKVVQDFPRVDRFQL